MNFIQKNKYYLHIAITLLVVVIIKIIDTHIKTDVCNDIAGYELAKDFDTSQAMVNAWTDNAKLWVAFDLGFDYLFILLYVSFIIISIQRVIAKIAQKSTLWIKMGKLLMYAQLVAGLFDALENYYLFKILLGAQNPAYPQYAFWFATVKFLFVALGLLYLLISAVKYRKLLFSKAK